MKCSELENDSRIYDFDILHPKAKMVPIVVFGSLSIAFFVSFLLGGSLIYLACFLFFSLFLYKNAVVVKKHKRITFKNKQIEILWESMNQSTSETIYISEIKNIQFDLTSGGIGTDYFVKINTSGKKIKFIVSMVQYKELKDHFEWYCNLHKIELSK
jgi:hypothetical protein